MMHVRGRPIQTELSPARSLGQFASPEDRAECKRLHRLYGTTYYFATCRFEQRLRRRVHALYGFVRVPDEWVDNPESPDLAKTRLESYRGELLRGLDGVCPSHAVLRAFCDVMHEVEMPLEEPLRFLDAMAQDLTVSRYRTYEELRNYMRGSASAVGLMMCAVMEAGKNPAMLTAAKSLGEAMQLTNFLRDVGEDCRRGRIYLPLEDLAHFRVEESDLQREKVTDQFRDLMSYEIARARTLYEAADAGIPMLPLYAQRSVRLARILYARILDHIEANDYDVFTRRARTSLTEKMWVAMCCK